MDEMEEEHRLRIVAFQFALDYSSEGYETNVEILIDRAENIYQWLKGGSK